jgi:hypothetical protein
LVCYKSFQNKKRREILRRKVWEKYSVGKHIVSEVSIDLKISPRSVHTYLNQVRRPTVTSATKPHHIMAIMDCVYFKRVCVYLVVRNWYTHKNIFYKRIPYETIGDYVNAVTYLESLGLTIDGIVVDGRKGVFEALSPTHSIQMCQFHQKQIVRRYITLHPQTEPGIALQEIAKELTQVDKQWFELLLDVWEFKYGGFIKERTINSETKHWFYTHKRLRSAYRSLRKNLPYLFTYQSVKNMPNTTNSLDSFFGHLKDAVSIHRGLKLHRKTKLIEYLIVR